MKVTRTDECPCRITFEELDVGDTFYFADDSSQNVYQKVRIGPRPGVGKYQREPIVTTFSFSNGVVANREPPMRVRRRPVVKLCAELVVAEDKS
jgi:hypothetical protein